MKGEELMQNADVIADRFYVMKQINSELDSMRKALRREAETINNSDKKEHMLAGIKKVSMRSWHFNC